jgi:hypothetical protein
MTLIAWNNGPIFRSGAVGTESACCCAQKNKVCTCSDPYGYAPLTVTAEVTLGSLASGSVGSCTAADAAAQVDGTYVLSYAGKNLADYFVYSTTLADGTEVVYEIRCTTAGGLYDSRLYMKFCDVGFPCFQRYDMEVALTSTLCALEYGATASETLTAAHTGNGFDSDLYNPFGGPVTCGSLPTYKAFFNVTVDITWQW